MEYKLFCENCESDIEWDKFIHKSENKNIFSLSDFLKSKKYKVKKIFIKKNKEVVASFGLFSKKNKVFQGDRIYTPINFKKYAKNNLSSYVYKKHQIIKTFLDYLLSEYQEGNFVLDYLTDDLRPFFWHNFEKNKKIFSLEEVRYTSILNLKESKVISNLDEFLRTNMFQNFSRSIKQQIKITMLNNFIFQENFDLKIAYQIIKKTFNEQNKSINYDFNEIDKIYKSLNKKNKLKMFTTSDNKKKILAFCIFGIIENKAIYLNGGRFGTGNNDYSLTYCLTKSLIYLQKKDINLFDLEGMNSPKRSFWKQGYGGKLLPYYKITFKN